MQMKISHLFSFRLDVALSDDFGAGLPARPPNSDHLQSYTANLSEDSPRERHLYREGQSWL